MSHFPVSSSLLDITALEKFIQQQYNLDQKYICKLLKTGINHTYLISDQNQNNYIFRVYYYQWRSKSEIAEELDFLNVLKNQNLHISYPISDKDQNFIQEIKAPEGIRYGVLFSFAKGNKIRVMNPETCYAIGVLMAQIHQVSQNKQSNRVDYNAKVLVKKSYDFAKTHFDASSPEMEFIKRQSEEITQFFENIDEQKVSKGIVHLDIWYDNMSVDNNNTPTIFDFDFCGTGLLILDLAYFCKQLFHIETDKKVYEQKVEQFLDGYRSIRPITDYELQLIPKAALAVWIFYLGIQSYRFDWSNTFLSENYLKILFVGKMKSWIAYHQKQ